MSCTASFEHEAGGAGAGADAGAAVVTLYRHGRDQAEPTLDGEHRGDLRLLVVLCAASAAMSLAALYFIASGLASV